MANKVVIFDVDETLGYFVQFGIVWECLQRYSEGHPSTSDFFRTQESKQSFFNVCLHTCPEFIRPNIFPILTYLKKKIQSDKCKALLIYTNNQGPDEWIRLILTFFEETARYPLFKHVVSAYKKKGKRLEFCRTSHKKTMSDFMNCSKLSVDSHMCFIDDTYYPDMLRDNVYYIKVNPFICMIPFDEIVDRLLKQTQLLTTVETPEVFKEDIMKMIHQYKFPYKKLTEKEAAFNKVISKKIMIHLQDFFKKKSGIRVGTRKNRPTSTKNKTRSYRNGLTKFSNQVFMLDKYDNNSL